VQPDGHERQAVPGLAGTRRGAPFPAHEDGGIHRALAVSDRGKSKRILGKKVLRFSPLGLPGNRGSASSAPYWQRSGKTLTKIDTFPRQIARGRFGYKIKLQPRTRSAAREEVQAYLPRLSNRAARSITQPQAEICRKSNFISCVEEAKMPIQW